MAPVHICCVDTGNHRSSSSVRCVFSHLSLGIIHRFARTTIKPSSSAEPYHKPNETLISVPQSPVDAPGFNLSTCQNPVSGAMKPVDITDCGLESANAPHVDTFSQCFLLEPGRRAKLLKRPRQRDTERERHTRVLSKSRLLCLAN